MYNGQQSKTGTDQDLNQNQNPDFFTPGVGQEPISANPDHEESINIANFGGGNPNIDPRQMGNHALNALGGPEEVPEEVAEVLGSAEQPGVMPPDYIPDEPANNEAEISEETNKQAVESIKTKEKLNKEGVKAIDDAKHKLDKDGNISDFYKTIREEMMPANLKNSYNRELGK